MDKKTAEKLEKVHPELARRTVQLIAVLAGFGYDVRVVQGIRTFKEQNDLYAQGRTLPGPRVTNAKAGQSNHNYGLAEDLCPFVNGKPDWKDAKKFAVIGREAKKLGLEWGGDWTSIKDMPHVQLKGMSVKECQTAYRNGGIEAVWKRMDALLKGAKPIVFLPGDDDLLELNDKGTAVENLQNQLLALGYLHAHEVDGVFGKITKNAVIGFQRQNKLTADGIVGDGTKAKLAQRIAEKNAFKNLRSEEINVQVPAANSAKAAELTKDVRAESENTFAGHEAVKTADIEDLSENIPVIFPPPFTDSLKQVEEKVSNTLETVQGTVEKTTTLTENIFDAKNIPAFIPRFGWQKWLALVPFGSFLTFVYTYLQSASWVALLSLGIITGAAVFGFFLLIFKHREFVASFVINCYKAMADPNSHNLIPTSAESAEGRQNELASSLKSLKF